jgi:hypothetical protein
MMAKGGLCGVLVLCCALGAPAAFADAPQQLKWEDLAPRLSAGENPFAKLSLEQLETLIDIAAVRERRAYGMSLTPQDLANERAGMAKLRKAGIDVDGLLARRKEVAAKQLALASAVNPAVDGKIVRLPGYVLPLEFSGRQVTEFLLVPWVGACIHTPPPPPNQIVHVIAEKPFDVSGSFDAVWITGRMAASAAKKSLELVDGAADIEIGYAMRAAQVQPYKRN